MTKRIVALACALMLLALAVAEGTANGDWTAKVLTDEQVTEQYPYRAVIDVNDGEQALVVSTTEESFIGDEDRAVLYIDDGGTPKQVMELGGAGGEKLYANAETHTLTYYYRLSGEAHIQVYHIAEGELVLETSVDCYQPYHDPKGDNAEPISYQDGAVIDEADSDALFARYAGEDDVVTYAAEQ